MREPPPVTGKKPPPVTGKNLPGSDPPLATMHVYIFCAPPAHPAVPPVPSVSSVQCAVCIPLPGSNDFISIEDINST